VLLRDDKSFPNIHVTAGHPFPQIRKHRGAAQGGALLRPLRLGGRVNRTLNQLQKAFLLRSCSDSRVREPHAALPAAPDQALLGPCTGDLEGGLRRAGRGRDASSPGAHQGCRSAREAEMQKAAEAMEFERAAALRDRIRALTAVQAHQGINPEGVEEADVSPSTRRAARPASGVLLPRQPELGQPRLFPPPTGSGAEPGEMLEAFLGQFYDDKPPPG
jgi:excinuclease ABC subunit C